MTDAGSYEQPGVQGQGTPSPELRRLYQMATRAVRQGIAARDRGDRQLAGVFFDLARRATDEYLAARRARLP